MKAKIGRILTIAAMIAMFVLAAGAPGSAGHRHGQKGNGHRFDVPDTTVARSVNWNRTGGKY